MFFHENLYPFSLRVSTTLFAGQRPATPWPALILASMYCFFEQMPSNKGKNKTNEWFVDHSLCPESLGVFPRLRAGVIRKKSHFDSHIASDNVDTYGGNSTQIIKESKFVVVVVETFVVGIMYKKKYSER